jgi:hypothetical protein
VTTSFGEEIKRFARSERYAARQVRKIIFSEKDPSRTEPVLTSSAVRRQNLMWTMVSGEVIGYIFLALSQNPGVFSILNLNAIILYLSSLLCQILTLLNAWFNKKLDLLHRLGFQVGLVVLATILIFIAAYYGDYQIKLSIVFVVLAYFTTAVIAIYLMMVDALVYAKDKVRYFDYNHYSRLVVLLGLAIGSGLFLIFS